MEILRRLRKEQKKTQAQVAKILGISQQAYATYELSTRTPPMDILISLANIYNCSVDFLLGRNENKNSSENTANDISNVITAEKLLSMGFDENKINKLSETDIALIRSYIKGLLDGKNN